jgi:sec-independent protein translocase protein TatB
MFDIGAVELLVIVIVAVLVIGPKELPLAMRTAGRWIGKVRKVSTHFRSGIDTMVREAEVEDMEKKWKSQNDAIMKRSAASSEAKAGEPVMTGPPPIEADDNPHGSAGADDFAAFPPSEPSSEPSSYPVDAPELPLPVRKKAKPKAASPLQKNGK